LGVIASQEARLPISVHSFRWALRRWPSGVTVVTMGEGSAAHGLTVSAFASVSLDPPIVLVCINASSRAHGLLRIRPHFAVNILSAGQRDVSEYFASARGESRLGGIAHRAGEVVTCPVLEGAAAVLECVAVESVASGDHVTYFGRVEASAASNLDPLLYIDGDYRDITFGRRRQSM
jgi:flavin reductase (DIM6/NTAB) family NADH-FMN oxidoreductase RutF